MAVHVIGFRDIIRYDGNTPIYKGRELINEYSDTAEYKALRPGDRVQASRHKPDIFYDFIAADPFNADLVISKDHSFGGPYATLYDAKQDTYYPMFLADFIAMASHTTITHGRVSGKFGFVKKNKNFGITFLSEL